MNRLKQLQEEAEKNFNNYQDDGYDQDDFDDEGYDQDGFDAEGYDRDGNHYEDYEESFANEGGLTAGSRTLNMTITNSTALPVDTKIFGAFRGNTATSNPGISLTIDGSEAGYNQFQREVASNPYVIKGIKMFVKVVSQFANKLTFTQYESTGEQSSAPFTPAIHMSENAQNNTLITAKSLSFLIGGKTELSLVVNANESINLVMTVVQKTDIANVAIGKAVNVTAKRPRRRAARRRK